MSQPAAQTIQHFAQFAVDAPGTIREDIRTLCSRFVAPTDSKISRYVRVIVEKCVQADCLQSVSPPDDDGHGSARYPSSNLAPRSLPRLGAPANGVRTPNHDRKTNHCARKAKAQAPEAGARLHGRLPGVPPTNTDDLAAHEVDISKTIHAVLYAPAQEHLPEPQYNHNLLAFAAGLNHGNSVEPRATTAFVIYFFANDDLVAAGERLPSPEGMHRFREALGPASPLRGYLDNKRPEWSRV